MPNIENKNKKALLVILDGFGINQSSTKNAIKAAKTPSIDYLFQNYPYTTISAGGELVGLPKGVMGNSEVGHMNLGAGRPIRQDLVRINESIEKDSLKNRPQMIQLIQNAKKKGRRVHMIGLLSDGGVHSHIDHIIHCANILHDNGIEVLFHAFMDGRDTPSNKGSHFLKKIQQLKSLTIASIMGRSIGMDRDRRWDKIEKAINCYLGNSLIEEIDPLEYIEREYSLSLGDEFISPVLFSKDYSLQNGDCLFMVNFRPDRMIQMATAFNDPSFKEFEIKVRPSYFLCMSPYISEEVKLPILFNKEPLQGVFSEFLSEDGLKQFKIAETEKFAHITFFFNGGRKKPFSGEEHFLIPSPRDVKTYDQKPEMSAFLILDRLIKEMEKNQHDFYLVNFANSDMVGHTGNFSAATLAIEALDQCISKLMATCSDLGITMLLTSDHGNSDDMEYDDGTPNTAHSKAPVPFSLFSPELKNKKMLPLHQNLALKDIAPTIFKVMGKKSPPIFTGKPIF